MTSAGASPFQAPLGIALAAAILLLAAPARADDAAAAKVLFDHGLDEMKLGHYPAGCSAILESYKRNPLAGALFTLAECEAKRGRIATAVKRYEEYVALFVSLTRDKQARQHGRDAVSKEQIGVLTAQMPRVTLLLTPAAGAVATLDGIPLEATALGGPLPVDPGEHVVFAQAPGRPPVQQRFTIDRWEQKTVALTLRPPPPAPETTPPALRIAGFVAGGLGLGLLGAGAVTGGLALGKKGTVLQNCQFHAGIASCNAAGLDAGNAVTALGAASTGTFIAGAIALGVGVALVIATPGAPAHAEGRATRLEVGLLSAGPSHATLGATGAW